MNNKLGFLFIRSKIPFVLDRGGVGRVSQIVSANYGGYCMEQVIVVFDIGKTNKKVCLFNRQYHLVHEIAAQLPQTRDEAGDPCEDLPRLTEWVLARWQEVMNLPKFEIVAVNFSTYGASLVLLGETGLPVAPLYNYLKPYPKYLQDQFYSQYGGEAEFSRRTASPVLGSLNSGMQLYRIKYERPDLFGQIVWALHLPQYFCYLFSGQCFSDCTSLGCHTHLWDFDQNQYHRWVAAESIQHKLAPIASIPAALSCREHPTIQVGIGLHDSSAALIPYQISGNEPFVLISTGTWCISLNPFNHDPLTAHELLNDCLCYLSYEGKPIKSARLFAGLEHEERTKQIADSFGISPHFYQSLTYESALEKQAAAQASPEKAYFSFMQSLVDRQVISTRLVLSDRSPVKQIFVDGGFAKNEIYLTLLAQAFPDLRVVAAEVGQASALGAALAMLPNWDR